MNNIIKSLITLLFITLTASLSGKNIVITVPQEFKIRELPLPPFPDESLKKLEVNSELSEVERHRVRDLKQRSIEYIYYFDFLDFTINNYLTLETELLGSNYNTLHFNSNIYNNSFLFKGSFNYISGLPGFNLLYKEYRLPFDIGLNLTEKSIGAGFYYLDYYNRIDLYGGIKDEMTDFKINYRNNYIFNQFLEVEYDKEIKGVIALGYMKFKLGIIYNDGIKPYVDFYYNLGDFGINIDTSWRDERYIMDLSYNNQFYIGLGYKNQDDLTPDNLFYRLGESYFPGERVIEFSKEYLLGEISFINGDITSIISCKLGFGGDISVKLDLGYKNIYSRLDFDFSDDLNLSLSLNYKAVIN